MRRIDGIAAWGALLIVSAALFGACGGPKTKPEAPVTVVTFGTPAADADEAEKPAARTPPTTTRRAPSEPASAVKEPEPTAETAAPAPAEASGNEIDLDAPPKSQPAADAPAPKRGSAKSRGKPQRATRATSRQKVAAAPESSAEPAADTKADDGKPAEAGGAASYSGPDPCQTAHFSVAAVRQACAEGGRSKAKGVMKRAIQKALAFGTSLRCSDCHVDQSSYALQSDAVARLRRWIE